jgi:hypothetical protein
MKQVSSASSSNAQCVTGDTSMNTHGNLHLPTESSRMIEGTIPCGRKNIIFVVHDYVMILICICLPGKEIAVTLLQEEDFPSSCSNIHSSMIHQPKCSAKRKRGW